MRSSPVKDFANKGNVVGVLHKDAVFESVGVIENELGKWHVGKDGKIICDNYVTQVQDDIPPELKKYYDKIPHIFKEFHLGALWQLPMQEGLKVGIIDTGVLPHSAIKQHITNLNPEVEIPATEIPNHGTTMACIIAGNDPENGIIGIAPGIEEIYSYTLPGKDAMPSMFLDALSKMEAKGVQLFNISYSQSNEVFGSAQELIALISQLNEKGCVLVCATGNHYNQFPLFYPAAYPNVISVAGLNPGLTPDIKSDFWKGVTVCMSSGHYFKKENFNKSFGTSSATALITGCIARAFKSVKFTEKFLAFQELLKKGKPIIFSDNNVTTETPAFDGNNFYQFLINQS